MAAKTYRQIRFQIIAGRLKGRKITVPDLGVTRPPLERIRRSLFDFLTPYLDDAEYLDLFSGTGSYLFEAVSRGVENATGVELENVLAEAINVQARKHELADRLSCRCGDVFDAIPTFARASKRFDLITLAPPQYKGLVEKTLTALGENWILTGSGLLVCQYATSENIEIDFHKFTLVETRKYGNTTFTVLKGKEKGDPEAA